VVTTRGAGITAAAGTCLTHHLFAKLTNGQKAQAPSIDFWTWQKLPQKEKAL